ncbi:MAG: PorT family protein [Candidatus Cardinium sp.]|uniref:outer membrane beta-barrel protein n=1 Tax=Cardinium endosymbiont of Dermatophagoides farinae TaxID=2597823 RepID=UPI001183E0CD|nr:outer membrane beta-barrel protein [Cardinium endosymbiont of Dermatophagoides farinae]TSJ80810.1 PorT family protein [Cardinium endosymbiont of Dermatophagoides farinae]UWW96814.1 MAG: PorT family protein [Candidatus Cardinium sp.]
MKGIKKTLMAGLLTCAALNHAHEAKAEANPLSYGFHLSGTISSAIGCSDEAKFGAKKAEPKFFDNLWFSPKIYVEYALADYFGMRLDVLYMRQGGTLEAEEEKNDDNSSSSSKSSISMAAHSVGIGLHACFYPLSLDGEDGAFRAMLGGSVSMPFKETYEKNGKDFTVDEGKKNELAGLDIAAVGTLGYEFPIGLTIEAQYRYNFLNRFKTEGDKEQTVFDNISKLKQLHTQSIALGVGYNFAALFSE